QSLDPENAGTRRPSAETNGFDVVSVGIDQEGRVIGRAVVAPKAGCAVVTATGGEPCCVKFVDRCAIAGAESDVNPARARSGRIKPKCRFSARSKPRARRVFGAKL